MGDEDESAKFAKLPLPDQFAHKNWKARKGGYEIAAREFKTAQPTDQIVRDFILDSNIWKGAVGDSNVAAQQEALGAYNAFLDASGAEGARKTRGVTVAPVVEKGLIGRPAAKAAAMETLLLLIELDKPDPIIEELLPFLSHKLPKIIVAALSALTAIYHTYGCRTVEPKPVLKLLPKAYAHADKNVRAEAQNLTVELYRWLREAMKPLFWNELKDLQQKDLEKLFEPVQSEPPPKQERLLRSQQAAKEEPIATGGGDTEVGDDAEDAGEIDLEPEFEALDVTSKIPKDFNERLASTKWKDRKDALDETFTAVNVPAIKEGAFDDVVRGCAKSMKDANIAVVQVAANVVEALAKGLKKKGFGRYRSVILGPMLERFKEKKQVVTDAIAAACDAVFLSTGLGDIQADVLENLKSKNPQVKEHSAKFLSRSIKATRDVPSMEQTKEFAEAAKKLLGESAAPLRDAGCEILGVLWKIMGDRNMLNHLDGLDDIKKAKIQEYSDAAEVKVKWKPKAAPPPKAAGGPAGRKPALGSKKPAGPGAKKVAPPRAASPALDETPLQPRPTSRPASKGPAGLKTPGAGIKPPSGLQKPGLRAPAASPKRQGFVMDEMPASPPPKSGLPPPGRGLAGRPLGKPPAAPASPPPQQRYDHGASSALSSIERQELSDLRAEVDLLRGQSSDLRQDKMRLSAQINELQNSNAQLIEDHTRDVLQIKAKETQLVRARSDAESAEDRANSLSKEIDRLKREMNRLGRASSGRESPMDSMNGDFSAVKPSHTSSRNGYAPPGGRAYRGMSNESFEGKENVPADGQGSKLSGFSAAPASQPSRPYSHASSGRATPLSGDDNPAGSTNGGHRSGTGEGQESWRRAAEVTQNLKARIEMMKARQNQTRG